MPESFTASETKWLAYCMFEGGVLAGALLWWLVGPVLTMTCGAVALGYCLWRLHREIRQEPST